MKVKKRPFAALAVLFLLFLFSLPVGAETVAIEEIAAENEAVAEGWETFVGALPAEIAALLPPSFFEDDFVAIGTDAGEAGTFSTILRVIGQLTGVTIGESLSLLAVICGILVLSAVLRAVVGETRGKLCAAVSLCTTLSITILIFGRGGARFSQIEIFFDTVRALSLALVPLMGTLYAMGGNVSAAVAHHGVMSGFLSILETVCSGAVVPIATVCVAMALFDAVADKSTLRPLSNLIKRTFTWGLSFLMMLLSFVLGLQSTLAKGADTLALRTARFAAGSFLPVVGSSVGEALRTVAGSVEYLRGAVGTGGIVVVFFAFLPTFLSVLFTRLAFLLGGAAAGMLSCTREEKLLSELASVWGYFLAVIACLFVMMVFSLTLFAHCAAAAG